MEEEAAQNTPNYVEKAVDMIKEVWQMPYAKELIVAGIVLLVAVFIIMKIRKHFAPIKLFNNSAGVVTVTPKALNELVQSVCYSMGTTNRPSVKIYQRRGRLCMQVAIKLEMGQKLADVSATLQDELTNACREHLGVEKLGRIDVKIKGFKGILKKSPIEDIEEKKSEPEDKPEEINDPFAPQNNQD
ncbi:MAG: hypothetical protein J6T16_03110 [Opitutales bacterium]|nr:hypothetical protein [Opitutales bacterium]